MRQQTMPGNGVMKKNRLSSAIAAIIGVAMIGLAAPAGADEFDDAFIAYSSGDFETARIFFLTLAEGGDIRAQFLLGRIYSEGQGVAKNEAESVKWYLLAASSGDIVSQLALGTMYVNGRGVKQDFVQAYSWFTIVAANGNRDMTSQALDVRDLIEQMMTSAQIEEAETIAAVWTPQ